MKVLGLMLTTKPMVVTYLVKASNFIHAIRGIIV